jgi:predicted transcriptional regulator
MLSSHHAKIISALRQSKNGLIYEQVASFIKLDKHQVGRRLNELEKMQIVYKPGEKRLTSTNRSAYVYKLVENGEKSAEPEKAMQGESIADYSRKLVQRELF